MAISPYATSAQVGESYSGLRAPQDATAFLSGQEQAEYTAALKGVGAQPRRKRSGKIKGEADFREQQASRADKVSRLRDIAAGRALGQMEQDIQQFSKPWKAVPNALISEVTTPDSLAASGNRTFGNLDVLAGRKMRDTLRGMVGADGSGARLIDPSLIGGSTYGGLTQRGIQQFAMSAEGSGRKTLAGRVLRGQRYAGGGMSGFGGNRATPIRRRLLQAKTTADVTNPELVYLGKGGFTRSPDFGF